MGINNKHLCILLNTDILQKVTEPRYLSGHNIPYGRTVSENTKLHQ